MNASTRHCEPPDRPIRADERSGVLYPHNLLRYDARWMTPTLSVSDVVDQYWQVRWKLEPGESIAQQIIDLPAITMSIEQGDVPAELVATGLQTKAWTRQIRGSGEVFAIRLRPAGLAVLSDLSPTDVADATARVTPDLDERLHALLAEISEQPTTEGRVRLADSLIARQIADRPPTAEGLLANAIVAELTARVRSRAGRSLADQFSAGERSIQRALKHTLGRGPKWVSRRIRLQEAARSLAAAEAPDLTALAVELGYSDQAHLINDFRRVAGTTPGAYVRALRQLTGDH
jgi:AraC-like DNA-binding protein